MDRAFRDAIEFHRMAGQPVAPKPRLVDPRTRDFRHDMIEEEYEELIDAMYRRDPGEDEVGQLARIADGIGDTIFVLWGTALAYGIPISEVLGEISRSNLTKTDGLARADTKVLKGPSYVPPDIRSIIERHMAAGGDGR